MVISWNNGPIEKEVKQLVTNQDGLQKIENNTSNHINIKDPSAVKQLYDELPYSVQQVSQILGSQLGNSDWGYRIVLDHSCESLQKKRLMFPDNLTMAGQKILTYAFKEVTSQFDIKTHQPKRNKIRVSIKENSGKKPLNILLRGITDITNRIGPSCKYFAPITTPDDIPTNYQTYKVYFKSSPGMRRSNSDYIRNQWIHLAFNSININCPNCESDTLKKSGNSMYCESCKFVVNINPKQINYSVPKVPTKSEIKTQLTQNIENNVDTDSVSVKNNLKPLYNGTVDETSIYTNLESISLQYDQKHLLWVEPSESNIVIFYHLTEKEVYNQTTSNNYDCYNCDSCSDIIGRGAYHTPRTGFMKVNIGFCENCHIKLTKQIITTIQEKCPEYISKVI